MGRTWREDNTGPTYGELWQFVVRRMTQLARTDPTFKETAAWTAYRGMAADHLKLIEQTMAGVVPDRLRQDLLEFIRNYIELKVTP